MAEEESSGRAVQVAPGGFLREPRSLLYSVDARIGGYGRDLNAHESLLLADECGYLGKAIGYDNLQQDISPRYITSLHWHPVRLLSKQPPALYDDAKKKYVDWTASRQLKSRKYDLFHGWSGSSLCSLRVAKERGIASVLEIPLWHIEKMNSQPVETSPPDTGKRSSETLLERGFTVRTEQILEEYDLPDLLLVPSEGSAKSFSGHRGSRGKALPAGCRSGYRALPRRHLFGAAEFFLRRTPHACSLLRGADSSKGGSRFA